MASPRSAGVAPVSVRFVEFELDEANATLLRDGRPLALAPTPFALLCALARRPGTLLTKDALLDAVWGHQFVSESVLKTAVSDLRMALGDDPRQPRLIETVPRRGYRFIASLSALPARSAPLPHAPDAPTPAVFVGRADALARLHASWSMARGSQRRLVWVAGEPGIGKTTLIDRFVSGVEGAACAHGQCVEHYGTGESYLPVLEALAGLCRRDEALPALLRAVAPTWLLQLPWLVATEEREALRRELAGVGPERMLREMGELLDRYAERRPVLVVIEDLHWSDRSTIHLLDHLARRRGPARVMWLGSFRLAEVVAGDHPLNRLRHELRMQRLCEEIVLDPFSESEIASYVAAEAQALAADEAFVRALHERTDGVPLFVASVLGEVMARTDAGGGPRVAGETLANLPVPENLAGIIEHFLMRLDGEERAMLETAAVCGTEFRTDTVAQALGRDPAWVAQACDRLVRAHTWLGAPKHVQDTRAPEHPWAFRHAFFREVLYERIAPPARAQLHRQVGAALERERERGATVPAAELAMHFDRGRDAVAALRYLAEGAEAALHHLSPDECMALTERALALLEQVPEGSARDALEITLSTVRGVAAVQTLGVGMEAKQALQRADALLDRVPRHPARGQLLHGLGFLLSMRGEYAEAMEVARRAVALSSTHEDAALLLTACTVQGEVHMMQGRPREARASIERALPAMATPVAGPDHGFVAAPPVMLLGQLAVQLFHLGLLAQSRARLREAHARAQQLRQPMAQLVVLWFDALLELRLGHAERVGRLADEMHTLVEESGLAQGRGAAHWFHGWAQAHRADARAGHARIRAGHDDNTALGMRAGGSEVLGYAAEALLLAGDADAADAELHEALQVAEALDERVYLPQLLLTEAAIARARGRRDVAAAAVRRALDEARAQQAPWWELVALLAFCEHEEAAPEERQALVSLLDALPEAADTAVAAKARARLA